MDKILAVARAEYLQAVRSKAFIIGVLLMPVLMGGSILVQIFLKDQVDLTERRCAVVDPSGEVWPLIAEQARIRNEEGIWEVDEDTGERSQVRPRIVFELHVPEEGEETDFELSQRVRDDELDGFLLLTDKVLDSDGRVGERPAAYHTNEPTFTETPRWLANVINTEARRIRFEAADLDKDQVARLDRRIDVATWGLATKTVSGAVKKGERENKARTFGVPAGSLFLLFMLIMTSAPALMNQVLEEKMQRISEVLVSAVSPFKLMMGKLIGSAFVSLTLAVLYIGAVIFATIYWDVAHFVPVELYFWFVALLLVALLMYGSVMSALGSACSELRDAQSMIMPAMIVIMIPLFAWSAVLEAPNGTVARAMTFFPTATPLILMMRVATEPGPPLWEVIVSMALCLATMVLFVWASSKVFRIGVLSQGQTPSFRALIGWVLSK